MEITFDIRGNLYPHRRIQLPFQQFKEVFIYSFPSDSIRVKLLENQLKFIQDFKEEITPNFIQWIDGSFISNKKNPNDIDFVTLIEHSIYRRKRELIDNKYRLLGSKERYGVDAYTIELFPKEHKKYLNSKSDLIYWDNWFTKTKMNWAKKSFPKGYIEIKFQTEIS